MQKQKRTGVEARKSESKTLSVPFDTPNLRRLAGVKPAAEILSEAKDLAKSLFRNILHITPLNPKIWTVLAGNSMIPQDQGEGGYPIPTS